MEKTVLEGDSAHLPCSSDTLENTNISWTKDGRQMPQQHTTLLSISSTKLSDAGEYLCQIDAPNKFKYSLIVRKPLSFRSRPNSCVIIPGRSLFMSYRIRLKTSVDWSVRWRLRKGQFTYDLMANETDKMSNSTVKVSNSAGWEYIFSLQIHQMDMFKAGEYYFDFEALEGSEVSGLARDTVAVGVSNDLCQTSPCSAVGTCHNVIDDNLISFSCSCIKGFTGKTCSSFDPEQLGMTGKSYFLTNEGQLTINCNFSPLAYDYIIELQRQNETEPFQTRKEKSISIKVDRSFDDSASIACKATLEMQGKRLTVHDDKIIHFLHELKFLDKFDLHIPNAEENDQATWTRNGYSLGYSNETSIELVADSTPGALQIIRYGNTVIEKHVTCPQSRNQKVICLVFVTINFVQTLIFLLIFSKVKKVQETTGNDEDVDNIENFSNDLNVNDDGNVSDDDCGRNEDFTNVSSTSSLDQEPHSDPNLFQKLKPTNVFQSLSSATQMLQKSNAWIYSTRSLTFIFNLHLFELITAILYLMSGDLVWGTVTLGLIVTVSGVKFSIFLLTRIDFNYGLTRKMLFLAFFNQTIPLVNADLSLFDESLVQDGTENIFQSQTDEPVGEPKKEELVLRHEKSKKALSMLIFCKSFQDLSLFVLNTYILIDSLGMKRICLPNEFNLKMWDKTTFEPLSHERGLVTNLENILKVSPNSRCDCKTWNSGSDFCFPKTRPDDNVGCSVADCYSSPSWVSFFVPLLQLGKSMFSISWTITSDVNPKPAKVHLTIIRFMFISWIVAISDILVLYGQHILITLESSDIHRATYLMMVLLIFQLLSPSYITGLTLGKASSKKKRSLFMSWFLLGSILHLLFFIFPLIALDKYKSGGCLRDMSKNRINFLPVQEPTKILYYSTTNKQWEESILKKYDNLYRVIKKDLYPNDRENFCEKGQECNFFNTRFETDNLIWIFLIIGYLGLTDCILSFGYNLLILHEYRALLAHIEQDDDREAKGQRETDFIENRQPQKRDNEHTSNDRLKQNESFQNKGNRKSDQNMAEKNRHPIQKNENIGTDLNVSGSGMASENKAGKSHRKYGGRDSDTEPDESAMEYENPAFSSDEGATHWMILE